MHTALLSAIKRTQSGDLRAGLGLGGRSVLGWQAATAQALGCRRIVCLCEAPTAEILDIQREVEANGGEFHAIQTSLQLVALLRSDDTLIVFADGLVIDRDFANSIALDARKLRKTVLTLPANHEMAEAHRDDLERIDANRSWAGLMVMHSALAQKLADFPPDGNVVSLLLRLALQDKTQACPIEINAGEVDDWVLATGREVVDRYERALVAQASPPVSWSAPGLALAHWIARLAAPYGLQRGPLGGTATALFLGATGAVLATLGYAVAALALLTFAAFSAGLSGAWANLARSLAGRKVKTSSSNNLSLLFDIIVVFSLIKVGLSVPVVLVTIPVFAIGLARLAAVNGPPSIAPFWNDRALHLAVFAVCAVYGMLNEALAVFGLAGLVQLLLCQWSKPPERAL